MKGAGKIILSVAFVSSLLLLYVHGQISLFHISYEIDAKAERLAKMSEDYRKLRFEVDQLRAPRLLESKLKELSLNLELPKEVRVVKVAAPETVNVPLKNLPVPAQERFFNLFRVDVAQAKENGQDAAE